MAITGELRGNLSLWEEILALSTDSRVVNKPWLTLGDFNQALKLENTYGNGSRISREMERLKNCMLDSSLFDLTYRGNHFTWWNNQEDSPIAKKIDRILVNRSWAVAFPLSYGFFEDPLFCDHCPSCVYSGSQTDRKRRSFMFSSFLTKHKDYTEIVHEKWKEEFVPGTTMFSFMKR